MTNCEPVARRKLLTCQIYGSLKFVLLSRFGDGFTVAELEQLLLKVLDAVFSVNEAASFKTCSRRNAAFMKNIISFSESNQALSPTPFVQDGACRHPQGVPVHDFSEIENLKIYIFLHFCFSFFSEFDWKWSSQIPIFGHRTSLGYLASSDSHFTEFPFYRECLAKK